MTVTVKIDVSKDKWGKFKAKVWENGMTITKFFERFIGLVVDGKIDVGDIVSTYKKVENYEKYEKYEKGENAEKVEKGEKVEKVEKEEKGEKYEKDERYKEISRRIDLLESSMIKDFKDLGTKSWIEKAIQTIFDRSIYESKKGIRSLIEHYYDEATARKIKDKFVEELIKKMPEAKEIIKEIEDERNFRREIERKLMVEYDVDVDEEYLKDLYSEFCDNLDRLTCEIEELVKKGKNDLAHRKICELAVDYIARVPTRHRMEFVKMLCNIPMVEASLHQVLGKDFMERILDIPIMK